MTNDVVPADDAGAEPINRHLLTVLAADLADLVEGAGGFLFDRARAGWDVAVRIGDCRDPRPLTILGVTPLPADPPAAAPSDAALAVSAKLLRDDPGVRAYVFERVRRGDTDLMAWGSDWPDNLGGRVTATAHHLSVAARAFKARALAAADLSRDVDGTETVFDLRSESFRPLASV